MHAPTLVLHDQSGDAIPEDALVAVRDGVDATPCHEEALGDQVSHLARVIDAART